MRSATSGAGSSRTLITRSPATGTWPRSARRRPSPRRSGAGRRTGSRASPAPGSRPSPATGRSTGCAASASGRRKLARGGRRAAAHRSDGRGRSDDRGIEDDRLRLMFTCCHPALVDRGAGRADAADARAGRGTVEIARAFLVAGADDGPAAGAREVRNSSRPAIPYRVPAAEDGLARTCWSRGARGVSTSCSTRATRSSCGRRGPASRREFAGRRSASVRLLPKLMPGRPESRALLALMLLPRRAPRPPASAPTGRLCWLEDQDRARWDRAAGLP